MNVMVLNHLRPSGYEISEFSVSLVTILVETNHLEPSKSQVLVHRILHSKILIFSVWIFHPIRTVHIVITVVEELRQ